SVSYAVYLHQQELKRPKRSRRIMRVASTKLQLTNELILLEQRQWLLEGPSYQPSSAFTRERQYRDALQRNMQQHIQRMQQMKRQHMEATFRQ
ncbi:hypothetical protein KR222_006656, partial [Zaprionus bogoriensis]